MIDHAKRLRGNCSCNFSSTPCGAEEECRNAFEGADHIERLEAALRDCMEMAEVHEIPFRDRMVYISEIARKALNTSQERVKNNGET